MVAATSSPHTVTGNFTWSWPTTASMMTRSEEVTSAYGTPAPATSATRASAPGSAVTVVLSTRATMSPTIHCATVSRLTGRAARASR